MEESKKPDINTPKQLAAVETEKKSKRQHLADQSLCKKSYTAQLDAELQRMSLRYKDVDDKDDQRE